MGAARKIPKDWRTATAKNSKSTTVVIDSDNLPKLLNSKHAAVILCRHVKTIEEYRKDGSLRFIKIRGRYFTTAEFIAQFIEAESKK